VVEVRPQVHIPGYKGLRVVIPSPLATDSDIEAQIDRLRGNFGELLPVDRPAQKGDFLTIDLQASHDGEPVSGLTTDDFLYELGSGSVLPELDDQLAGSKVGDILAFDADVPGTGAANFRVLVKEIKEKKLPELTDEWASEASEFETVEELRADITKRMSLVKRVQATMALRNNALEALIELVVDEPPASMVDSEVQRQLHELSHRLESQGATINDYLQATGQSGEDLVAALRQQAIPSVKADLALRAVAEAEGIDPTAEDLDAEIERLAGSYRMKPAQLRRELERAEQLPAVRSDWKKSRALEWLIEHVEIVDTEGELVDRSLLEPDPEALAAPGDGQTRADSDAAAPEPAATTEGADTTGDAEAGEPLPAAEQVSEAADAAVDEETGHR
jgi:trigger factor